MKHIFKIGSTKKGLQGNAMSVKLLQWSGNTGKCKWVPMSKYVMADCDD